MITTSDLAGLVLDHMALHGLPEPASVTLVRYGGRGITVQVDGAGAVEEIRTLLRWVCSLPGATVGAWRPAEGHVVHIEVRTTVSGPAGAEALLVYGGVPFDEERFGDLEPGGRRPVSLSQLTAWAGGTGVAA